MLRLVGFILLVLVVHSVLSQLPGIGPIFQRLGCIGVWLTAMGLSWALSTQGKRAFRIRRDRGRMRELATVDSPHNHGKIGTLYLAQGRPRRALPHFERAAEGEPETAEWQFRLGSTLVELRRNDEAIAALERCVALDPEHGYGAAQLRLAETLARAQRHEEALAALDVFARNHGPSPEEAYRRGRALKALGRRDEAKSSFDEVARIARSAPRYQRREAGLWTARAKWAGLF